MKQVFFCIILFLPSFSILSQSRFVNPFIGTDGHGHTFPGATTPFGMVQLSPDTRVDGSWDGCSGYHYSDKKLYGFSHTHLSGTGCSDYGDILLQSFVWEKDGAIPNDFKVEFSHLAEDASAGYYAVRPENGILCEMTASPRVGFHRYDFGAYQKEGKPMTITDTQNSLHTGIVLDLYHRDDLLDFEIIVANKNEVHGFRRSKAWAKDQIVYYSIVFSEPFERYFILDKDNHTARSGAKVAFDFGKKTNIKVKVGISGVDAKGASKNLAKEIPHWDFEKTKAEAVSSWDKELSKIQVEGGTKQQNTVFYTALYHCMIAPNVYSDVDGQYRGRDNKIHNTGGDWEYYTVFSLWDTYRALHPLLTIIDEKRTNHFIRTFIRQYEEGGLLPVWELAANETNCMIGYHAVSVIADAYMKGIRDYDTEKAFEAMKYSAMQDHYGLSAYKKYGYIPSDKEHESVSKTLEYAYDDWCIAQMAKEMGKNEDYDYFIKRSQGYLSLYDKETGFFRPRKNGGWYSPFRPSEINNHYTEGNAYHYSFGNQHNIYEFQAILADNDSLLAVRLRQKLDSLFYTKQKMTGREQVDVTGLIGQYAHGNEPSHHIPYIYMMGKKEMPYITQKLVHQIKEVFYTENPDGLCGNEDCGQMSAWYIWSALGLYPVAPADNRLYFGTPSFPKATILRQNGQTILIKAENLSPENYYVKQIEVNGNLQSNSLIYIAPPQKRESVIAKYPYLLGTKNTSITFQMMKEPLNPSNIALKSSPDLKKTKDIDHLRSPIIIANKKTFKDSLLIEINGDGVVYTTDGIEPNFYSRPYLGPFYIHETTTIKAKWMPYPGQEEYPPTEAHFYKVHAEYRASLMNCKPNSQYYADGEQSLIDGVRGDRNWRLGDWMGFQGQEVEVVVDLGKLRKINKISVGCLQDFGSWIAMPTEVIFEIAKDGGDFEVIGTVKNDISDRESENIIKDFTFKTDRYARRIRVKAKNYGPLPEWHPGAGGETFIFMDEISIE